MATIYVSSTFADLKEHRQKVYRALHKLAGHEVLAMEDYNASDQRPLDKCLADVARCDIYIGVIAWRYGFVPSAGNPEGRSITELEYLKARELKKECLIFLLQPDAAWSPALMDSMTLLGGAAQQIVRFRKELETAHTVQYFGNQDELATLAATAVTDWIRRQSPPGGNGPQQSARGSAPLLREITQTVFLAYSPLDSEPVETWAGRLGPRGISVSLSPKALFAEDEAGYVNVEKAVIECHTGLIAVSRASLGQLAGRAEAVARILGLLRDRTGPLGALLIGVSPQDLPAEWTFDGVFQVVEGASLGGAAGDTAISQMAHWLASRVPEKGKRSVGLPVILLAMTQTELRQLREHPETLRDRLGNTTYEQFGALCSALKNGSAGWEDRYAETRKGWRPFGPEGREVDGIVRQIAGDLNERDLPRLRQRHIKIQHYPFDDVVRRNPLTRRIYRDVAQTGCVMIIDEVSMFHPDLREAFLGSPFASSQQVSLVTVSPISQSRGIVNQVLERETRSRLAGAFDRFAYDYDPQCEFAVDDERRLKRWLHACLPETVRTLREPRPDRDALRLFAEEVGGDAARRGIPDTIWSEGGRP